MPDNFSLAALLSSLSESDRQSLIASLTPEQAEQLGWDWRFWARPNQLAPGTDGAVSPREDWRTWLLLAGRGFGKSRCGAEWVREQVESGRCRRLALVAPTAADARDVMVEGESGVLNVSPPSFKPLYEPSKRRLTWPNGAIATLFSADEPERLRGPQHDGAWCDELASWRYPEAWDMLMFGLRLGRDPRVVVTTTPKPVKLLRDLLKDPGCVVTRGSTYDNVVNLAPTFARQIISKYEGTRLGRQELMAEVLEDVPGALWTRQRIEALRVAEAPRFNRVVVAVDPAATSGEDSDETGIVVVGLGKDAQGYVLADRTCRLTPDGWGREAVAAYHEFKADRIVAEVNNGGEMVELVIRTVDTGVAYTPVRATRGKRVRAEPVAALYEQGRVHHVGAQFGRLEDQMCTYVPEHTDDDDSPDRVDALVWALTELMLGSNAEAWIEMMRLRAERIQRGDYIPGAGVAPPDELQNQDPEGWAAYMRRKSQAA